MLDFTLETLSSEDMERLPALYEPLGEAASDGVNPRLTGTISFRYVRATRLGQLHAEAITTRTDGVKTFAAGHLADEDGVTVEAEGVFILPRWARDQTD